jgi:Zn-dependent oligopeptidase
LEQQVVAINQDITALAYEFSVAASSGDDLSGVSLRLDEGAIASLPPKLAKSVRRHGEQAVLPLSSSAVMTVLQHVDNEALRRQAFVLSQRHSPRALKLLDALLLKRDELAKVLEFPSYADLSLVNRLAKKPATVHRFLDDLSQVVRDKANKVRACVRCAELECDLNSDAVECRRSTCSRD